MNFWVVVVQNLFSWASRSRGEASFHSRIIFSGSLQEAVQFPVR